jgi:transcriptional regulator with XRE-family HTH domain
MSVPNSNSLGLPPNPSRLMLARKRRGYTKTRFAELIGVDVRAVSGFESVLGFPEEFFFGDDLEEPNSDNVSFRAMTRMSAAKRDMALSQGAIAFHFNDWLETRFELPKSALPDLSRESQPEAASESLRRSWGIGELSVRNMIHLLEAKGVKIF